MRGSDQSASLYWLGRMLEGGEDPLYVARRLVRFASEDVGKWLPAVGMVSPSQHIPVAERGKLNWVKGRLGAGYSEGDETQ